MENREHEKLDQLLRSKMYHELTDEEKQWVTEQLGDASTYQKLCTLIHRVSGEEIAKVPESIKQSLVAKMKFQHQPGWVNVFNYKISAFASFMAIVGVIVIYTFFVPPKEVIVEKRVEIPSKPTIDTIFVRAETDTVLIEKIKEVPVYLTIEKETPEETTLPLVTLSGKSLADQEEIRNLLTRLEK